MPQLFVQPLALLTVVTGLSYPRSISVLDYPHCVVHELPELTAESLVSHTVSLAWGRGRGV